MNLLWDGVQDLGEDSSRGAPDMSVDEPPTRAPAGTACSRNKGQGRDRKQVITIINFTKISTALERWCFQPRRCHDRSVHSCSDVGGCQG